MAWGRRSSDSGNNSKGDSFDAQYNHSQTQVNANGVKPLPEGKKQSGETATDGSGPVTKVTGGNGKR